MLKVNAKSKWRRSDTNIFSRGSGRHTVSTPTPHLAPLARLSTRGLLVRIPASNLTRNEVSYVTFAKVKQPLDPRTKCSLRLMKLFSAPEPASLSRSQRLRKGLPPLLPQAPGAHGGTKSNKIRSRVGEWITKSNKLWLHLIQLQAWSSLSFKSLAQSSRFRVE